MINLKKMHALHVLSGNVYKIRYARKAKVIAPSYVEDSNKN
jgi:hypothetical protein